MVQLTRRRLNCTTIASSPLLFFALFSHQALAQEVAVPAATDAPDASADIVVTGSRIRQSASETVAPVAMIGQEYLSERGFTQVGEALNAISSIVPSSPEANGSGSAAGSGQQFPNLFGLGGGRTLTLIDGRRMVTTASGLGDRVVDTNIIPRGLVKRIDVVQAGGAAVYGTDAIAGVVNYVLQKDFQGVTLDLQTGISSRGDYPRYSFSGLFGTSFAEGRGNIAVDLEYNKTDPLAFGSRPITDPVIRTTGNPLNGSPTDGIPSRTPIIDPRFWEMNQNGVVFASPAPDLSQILGQFSPDGSGVGSFDAGKPYAAGFPCAIPFCSGGDGYPYGRLASMRSGVETYSGTAVGHYDLTDRLKISGEFLYARSTTSDPLGSQAPNSYVLGDAGSGDQPVTFTRQNPFLTTNAIAALSALSPGFAAGGPLFLSKAYEDLLPTREYTYRTDTYRAVLSADGDFDVGSRKFYYSATYTRGVVNGLTSGFNVYTSAFLNALDAVRNSSGTIVCAINAVTITDAACSPINPFGTGNISDAARLYATRPTGSTYKNTQDDYLANLSGAFVTLPAGDAKFSIGYEHRVERATFTPFIANQLGLFAGNVSAPTSGAFSTNEYSGEVLIPLIGRDVILPLVEELEVSGQYRIVNNSIAGKENVWGAGVRWNVGYGLTLRGSRSRNFRAPSLDQLFAPSTTALSFGVTNPCDPRFIGTGVAPETRQANCRALFAANPSFGSLANFSDPGVNFSTVAVTTGGNANLGNEVSNTTTLGLVWQPDYVPGRLTIIADRIKVDLEGGLTQFTPSNFTTACFDASPQPADICGNFALDPVTGYVISANNTTVNAAAVKYRGEVFNISYQFPVEWIVGGSHSGTLLLSLDATHNAQLSTVVAGVTTESANTIRLPNWVLRGNVTYRRGPFVLSYEGNYLPKSKIDSFDTIESTPFPTVPANLRHNLSGSYDFGSLELRAGINNITDRGPSFSTVLTYGEMVGREFFIGARAKF